MLKNKETENRVITIGCRLNQAEGDALRTVKFDRRQPTLILNTCAVTQEAVRTSWKTIRRYLKTKTDKTKLVVTGCLATLEKTKMDKYPGIDLVITQQEKLKFLNRSTTDTGAILKPLRSRPVIKVQDGCSNHCSFCIASIIRAHPKSTAKEPIINKINGLVAAGFQEIVLSGLNLGLYGIDIGSSLTELIKSIGSASYRIRLSSLQPDTITDQLIELWSDNNLCRHLHIPLQSGDNRILQLMARKYKVDDYCRLIDKIYQKIPGVNIGTDIIAGFPTEDDESFIQTYKIVEKLPFGYLHVFPYSVRAGTGAALLTDNVLGKIKKERVRALRELGDKKKSDFRQKFRNKEMSVIAEARDRGLTDNYLTVTLNQAEKYQKGKLYNITIKE